MKKLLLIAVLMLALMFPVIGAAEMNNVTAEGIDGNLVYKDASGNIINKWDAANRKISIPSGSALDMDSGSYLYMSSFAIATHSYTAGADWVMSESEAKSILLTVSSGSGTPSIIAPSASGKLYMLRNAANIAVTLKRSGGTGISVASGKTAILMDNGSDYVRVTGDATH